jgi:hypothetical protein
MIKMITGDIDRCIQGKNLNRRISNPERQRQIRKIEG